MINSSRHTSDESVNVTSSDDSNSETEENKTIIENQQPSTLTNDQDSSQITTSPSQTSNSQSILSHAFIPNNSAKKKSKSKSSPTLPLSIRNFSKSPIHRTRSKIIRKSSKRDH